MLLSLLLLSLLLSLLLLLFEFELEPRLAARESEEARKFKKVKVEIAPPVSQADSPSTFSEKKDRLSMKSFDAANKYKYLWSQPRCRQRILSLWIGASVLFSRHLGKSVKDNDKILFKESTTRDKTRQARKI